jgi:hypothetical protein
MLLVVVCFFHLITGSTASCEEINPKCFIERAGLVLQDRFSQEHMQEAIRAYEELLPLDLRATVLNRLAQLHFEKTLFIPELSHTR